MYYSSGKSTSSKDSMYIKTIYIFIDCENISNITALPAIWNARYILILGKNQVHVSKNLLLAMNDRSVYTMDCVVSGKNALDFVIAFELGRRYEQDKDRPNDYYIVSKDKGFDAIVAHANSLFGFEAVQRVERLEDLPNEMPRGFEVKWRNNMLTI